MIWVNERPVPFEPGMLVKDLAAAMKPDADLMVVNGFVTPPDTSLNDGDRCWLIKRGETPSSEEMERLLYARHTPGVHQRLKTATVGVMGLGGLGSVVAVALARMGIGKLVLADYDVVEPTNLNRQQYFIDQIGMRKTEALRANLARVNPYVAVETVDEVDRRIDSGTFSSRGRVSRVLRRCCHESSSPAGGVAGPEGCLLRRLFGPGWLW